MIEVIQIKEKGFLSMEVLFITAMIAVLASVCGMYVTGGKMVVASANLTTAAFLAEKQMACVKGLLSAKVGLVGNVAWQDKEDKLPLVKNGAEFTVTTTVENAGDHRLKRILIHVAWHENAMERSIQLESLGLANE